MEIPIAKTILTEEDIKSVQGPLRDGWLVQGPKVKEFEDAFSLFVGCKNSIAVTSCTSALYLSLVSVGFKPGDEAIVPAFTWISTANVVEHLGGKVIFADIDPLTFNIKYEEIESLINPKTKAILPVHLFGLAADMNAINQIASKHNVHIIEDAACGFGSTINNQHVGTFGTTGCFSFHPRKSITTGEGGMICTNDNKLAERIRSLRNHGAEITDLQRHLGPKPYLLAEHREAGYNFRMTDMQGSLGLSQMKRAALIIQERQRIASRYDEGLRGISWLKTPKCPLGFEHSYQSYPCIYEPDLISKIDLTNDPYKIELIKEKRNKLMDKLQKLGISTRPSTHAVHMLDYYEKKYNLMPEKYPNSMVANNCSISLPLFNGMKDDEIDYVINNVRNT